MTSASKKRSPRKPPRKHPENEHRTENDVIWAVLVHLSLNMWCDRDLPLPKDAPLVRRYGSVKPYLRFDTGLWHDLLKQMSAAGINMVVIDLGDAVRYESHPEIAVRKAWSTERLKRELEKVRKLGLEPIPKLNFSTCHDAWLGPYSRCVSTDTYYAVCRDLIAEVIDLFDRPRFFHLGMDEETAHHQRNFSYVVVRQYDLWWHDLMFLLDQVEKGGSRAWIWSDYLWDHPQVFFKKMPKSVLQSNWYYGTEFTKRNVAAKAYLDLEAHRYDQIPTGSNWSVDENFAKTVTYGRKNISPRRLLGFLMAPWFPTVEPFRDKLTKAVELVRDAIED